MGCYSVRLPPYSTVKKGMLANGIRIEAVVMPGSPTFGAALRRTEREIRRRARERRRAEFWANVRWALCPLVRHL